MRNSIFLLTLITTFVTATPTQILHKPDVNLNPPTVDPSLGLESPTATILFDVDGNEARANFKIPIPGKRAVNQRLLALSVQSINNLGPGQDRMDVVCQGFGGTGEALGKPFDLLTRVVLSGNEKKQLVVGSIECNIIRGGLSARVP